MPPADKIPLLEKAVEDLTKEIAALDAIVNDPSVDPADRKAAEHKRILLSQMLEETQAELAKLEAQA